MKRISIFFIQYVMIKTSLHIKFFQAVLALLLSMPMLLSAGTVEVALEENSSVEHHQNSFGKNLLDKTDACSHNYYGVTFSSGGFLFLDVVADDKKAYKSVNDFKLDHSTLTKGKIKVFDDHEFRRKPISKKELFYTKEKNLPCAHGFLLSSKTQLFILYSCLKLEC